MKKKGDYQIPFDKDGNQQCYPERQWVCMGDKSYCEDPEWKDNHEFDDTLTMANYDRGRSAVVFIMRRTNGKTVSVFISDFWNMANSETFSGGKITGRFTFCKKGANYGCRMVET